LLLLLQLQLALWVLLVLILVRLSLGTAAIKIFTWAAAVYSFSHPAGAFERSMPQVLQTLASCEQDRGAVFRRMQRAEQQLCIRKTYLTASSTDHEPGPCGKPCWPHRWGPQGGAAGAARGLHVASSSRRRCYRRWHCAIGGSFTAHGQATPQDATHDRLTRCSCKQSGYTVCSSMCCSCQRMGPAGPSPLPPADPVAVNLKRSHIPTRWVICVT
jgi:hypothetical protein